MNAFIALAVHSLCYIVVSLDFGGRDEKIYKASVMFPNDILNVVMTRIGKWAV